MRTPRSTVGSYSNAGCGVRFSRSSRASRPCRTPCAASRPARLCCCSSSEPRTLTKTRACRKSGEVSTPVTVTNPILGSLSSPTASDNTWRTASLTRRLRLLINWYSTRVALRALPLAAAAPCGVRLLRPRGPIRRREQLHIPAAVASGAVIGFLGGVVGLILGSLRMPALLRFVGEEPVRAVGTNLLVGVFVGAAGVVGHVPGGIDWVAFAIGAAVSVPGALLGARLTGRLDERQLLRAIGIVLLFAGAITLLQAAV